MIITVKGLSGTGVKETAQELAKKLDFEFLSISAIYRLVALNAADYGISWKEEDRVKDMLAYTNIKLKKDANQNISYLLNGDNVTAHLFDPRVNFYVGNFAEIPAVRNFVENFVKTQAEKMENLVCEGRDAEITLFPNADLKVFLTADIDKRAEKTANTLTQAGKKVDIKTVKSNLIQKDMHKKREDIFTASENSVAIDVSNLSVAETVQEICDSLENVNQKQKHEYYKLKSSACRGKSTKIKPNGLDKLKI